MDCRKIIEIITFILFFLPTALIAKEGQTESILFEFKLQKNEVLTIDKYQDIRISNGQFWQTREEKNRIVLKVNQVVDNGAQLSGVFTTYTRSPRRTGLFRLNQSYDSNFIIKKNGQYLVPKKFTMPNLRSMPSFPDHKLKKNDTWTANAVEVLDIAGMHILIPVKAQYTYKGTDDLVVPGIKRRRLHRIDYKYTFNFPVKQRLSAVKRISGFTISSLWFDREQGIPVYDTSRLVYDFQLASGAHQKLMFRIESWYNKKQQIADLQKDKIIFSIKKNLNNKLDKERLNIRKNKEGIILELGDILFQHNKASLTAQAQSSINQVANILKSHANKEIRILGHTDSSGNSNYNMKLSSHRAKTVLQTLTSKHGIEGKRLSYRGYGEKKPIVSNATPEGRARNRRVEILIVTD